MIFINLAPNCKTWPQACFMPAYTFKLVAFWVCKC